MFQPDSSAMAAIVPDPDTQQNLFQQAARDAQAGDLLQARRTCEQALASDPGNASGLQLLAMICRHLGDAQKAKSLLHQALSSNPQLPGAWYELGNLLDTEQEHQGALDAYEKAVQQQPEFTDAWRKLGIKQAETGNLRQARNSLERVLKSAPKDIQALYSLAQVKQETDDYAGAIECYQQALAIDPENVHLLHSLGIVFRLSDRREDALNCYTQALAIDSDSPELLQSHGHVLKELGRIDEARQSYQRALTSKPDALDVHENLNSLYWQYGMHDHYLQSYPVAIQSQPRSLPLRLQYANALLQIGHVDDAEEVLCQAQIEFGQEAESSHGLNRLSGQILQRKGSHSAARECFETAIELEPTDIRSREDIARLLILEGDYQQGLEHIEAVAGLAPFNQSLIAYRSLCWRLLDDKRAAVVNDYERFIKAYKIPLPEGYQSHAQFNQALSRCLDSLHQTRVQPIGQTLRSGTQTQGNIFDRQLKEIQEIRQSIEQIVRRYIDSMEMQAGHPLLSRKCKQFRFSDSWSCRLSEQGFHTNHIHPEGWISSCYYVQLPEAVHTSEDKQGWIKFGETNLHLGSRESIARYIQPEEGLLVLFPSYVFHGTVPFSSAETRTTIAFDVLPDNSSPG